MARIFPTCLITFISGGRHHSRHSLDSKRGLPSKRMMIEHEATVQLYSVVWGMAFENTLHINNVSFLLKYSHTLLLLAPARESKSNKNKTILVDIQCKGYSRVQ